MKLPFYIAHRYLFSKKSHNAINIISLIAVCGVAVATMAAVCTMSVLNGFQGLVAGMFGEFDPQLKITPIKGKYFDPSTDCFLEVRSMSEVDKISETIEGNALISYRERQAAATVKGVDENFYLMRHPDSLIFDGNTELATEPSFTTHIGVGLATRIGVNAGFVFPMQLIAPKRRERVNLANPAASVNREYCYIAGVFRVNQAVYDDNYMLVPIELARSLFDCENEVSALEIKLKGGVSEAKTKQKIQQAVGENFAVQNRFEQQADVYKMIQIEKWVSFLMLCFILLIAVFNIIGSLSMLIIEKQEDVKILRNMGADKRLITGIFRLEGWLISALGTAVGITLGVILCLCQHYFGWLKLGTGANFVVNAYPVSLEASDLLIVALASLLIGFLSVVFPVRYLAKRWLN
jgi:ABC-type lipoprotein release transport system permease subunit